MNGLFLKLTLRRIDGEFIRTYASLILLSRHFVPYLYHVFYNAIALLQHPVGGIAYKGTLLI